MYSFNGYKVAILHYSNSIIDLNKPFGMQRMELGELKVLREAGVIATLYAKEVIGNHPQLKAIPYLETDKLLLDIPFYQRFLDSNTNADIYQGNATPLLALFKPEKTIIRFDGVVPLPLVDIKGVKDQYAKASYIFVSKSIKNYYLKNYPFLNPEKCHVLYNAVDSFPIQTRKKINNFRILFCSRWSYEKGIDLLIKSLKFLQRIHNNYELIVAGGMQKTSSADAKGSAREEKIKETLRSFKNVKVLGFVPHDELMKLYSEVDLLLFPSIYPEPFGLIAAEAAVACVPTCAYSVGAIPEVVKHKETGVLMPFSDKNIINVIRLVKTLSFCIRNRNMLDDMGVAARKRVISNFNWENYRRDLFHIYSSICK
ncbi:MAG: glycosyltransferase family 4 protein [Syntrophotaleaceae bacterium]